MSQATLELLRHESVNTLPNASPSPRREIDRMARANGQYGLDSDVAVNVVVEKRSEMALLPATIKPLPTTLVGSEASSDVKGSLIINQITQTGGLKERFQKQGSK